ncbi:MAG TPA: hypothetical protein VH988_31210 [Thermoanaerobaculia bacterium]|jgi:hypothetical protein|nr:hypothetical protein [Thermoanaerobaculia bacterium]
MTSALLGAALLAANLASAQSNRDRDDKGEPATSNYALGVGVGLVQPTGQTENYYMAALRIRLNREDEDNGGGGGGGRDRGIQGYLEPEIGYWKSTDRLIKGSDTLLGINLIGAFPFASAETFLGAGVGAHFVDANVLRSDASLSGSQTKLGANAQFGIDLHITRALTVFGAGRFDLVQGAKDNVQSKIYLGLRAHL